MPLGGLAAALALILAAPSGGLAQQPTGWIEDPFLRGVAAPPARTRGQARIVNGVLSPQGRYPFMALMMLRGEDGPAPFCGGARIAPEWVLTAAHCFVVTDKDDKVLGQIHPTRFFLRQGGVSQTDGAALEISEVVVHPDYRPEITYADIALLRLRQPDDAPTAALPAAGREPASGATVTIVGWGKQRFGADEPMSDRLREGRTRIVGRRECQGVHDAVMKFIRESNPDARSNGPIDSTRLCAEVENVERPVSVCQGDSGGPLLTQTARGYVAVGVVSYGFNCAVPGVHAVYTNVAHYRRWIESVTGRTDFDGAPPSPPPSPSPAPPPVVAVAPPQPGGQDHLTDIVSEATLRVSVRGGPSVRPGQSLVFDVESGLTGELILFDVSGEGEPRQIFPNHRTEGRVPEVVRAGSRFTTPTSRHGFRFRAPDAPGEHIVYAVVTTPGSGRPPPRTRGIGRMPQPQSYLSGVEASVRESCAAPGVTCAIDAIRLVVQ